ncbi:MAG: flavodoxin family protein [Candidatus Theseobacter exili]|nr:flavodoxin family protein [Candidatus Theseobacter exili]
MKVIAFNGSARKDGNTAILVRQVFTELEKEGIETELVHLAGKQIFGCKACMQCFANKNMQCIIKKDDVNEYVQKMSEADGIILASPTYFTDVSSEMKALIDRVGMVIRANDNLLKRKVGAAVVAVRRAGSIHVFDTINHFYTISEMIIPGSCYWNMGIGREIGEVNSDEEGKMTMSVLGQNMAWLLKKINQ